MVRATLTSVGTLGLKFIFCCTLLCKLLRMLQNFLCFNPFFKVLLFRMSSGRLIFEVTKMRGRE